MTNNQSGQGPQDPGLLPDLTKAQLGEILNSDPDGALGRATQRVLKNLDDPNGVISAFQNYPKSAS